MLNVITFSLDALEDLNDPSVVDLPYAPRELGLSLRVFSAPTLLLLIPSVILPYASRELSLTHVLSYSEEARQVVTRGRSLISSCSSPIPSRTCRASRSCICFVLRRNVSPSGIMFDATGKDKMIGNHEVSPGCPKDNSRSISGESGDVLQQIPGPEDGLVAPSYDSANANNSMVWEPYASLQKGYFQTFYRPETYPLPYFHPDHVMWQQFQLNAFQNNAYPINQDYLFPTEYRFSYMPPINMFSQAYSHQFQIQEFQYFVVIDFEATCDKERNPHPQEIIEFPSVLVNSTTGQIEAVFQTYVRPAYHQHLTDFCKELTGIQQIQVDRGVPLSEALLMHDKWLENKGIKNKNFAVVTWSNWDCRIILDYECRYKKIRKPSYFNRWINLKVPFQKMFQGAWCTLKESVQLAGLTWEGRAHCGLDDARNTARLLVHLMDMGFKFSITNYIPETTEFPENYEPLREVLLDHNQHTSKPKELVGPGGKENGSCCYCGVLCSKCVVRKPGSTQDRCFFGCGNRTAAGQAVCNYFAWASP
ncbi:ERI1 exoribonuclease 2-like [Canna indica]|uniref:ERI1 exoribonuclease 2-like n=1 Tax=Canna indica TaxID=4628 RepID=A0AAQ3KBJ6_9LILI|nr:ERI1 exoribonuclease 2-like [Canna indica]